MIRHCVFVKFRADVPEAERAAIYGQIEALQAVVPGIIEARFGPNVSSEGLGKGFDDGFVIDFVDAGARDAYLVHPDHQAAAGRLVGALEGGVDGVVVFDLDV